MRINIDPAELKRMRDDLEKEFLRKEFKSYLRNPRFMIDMVLMNIFMPQTPFRALAKYVVSGRFAAFTEFIKAEETRRFP